MNTNEQDYRFLKPNIDTIKASDEWPENELNSGEWRKAPSNIVGKTLHSSWPIYRRRILPPTDAPTLLPFDLKKAKAGAKLVTRDGREAKFLTDERFNVNRPLVVLQGGEISYRTVNGRVYMQTEEQFNDNLDLFIQE